MGLVFLNEDYLTKTDSQAVKGVDDNVFKEFDYMTRKIGKAKMLVVVLEAKLLDTNKWRGPVNFNLGGRKYHDMSGNLDDPAYLKTNVDELAAKIREQSNLPVTTDIPAAAAGVTTNIPAAAAAAAAGNSAGNTTQSAKPAVAMPTSVPAPPLDNEFRQAALKKPVKGLIKNETKKLMNSRQAEVVFNLAYKFKVREIHPNLVNSE